MTSQSYIPKTRQIILPTAIINVYNKHGEFVKCRALLDSGSQSNFCTKFLFDKFQLTGKDIAAPVSGISQSICNITCKTETIMKSALLLLRKLAKNSNLRQEYNNFLKEYEDLGHMTLTSFDKCDYDIVIYLPHHAVIKQTSSTTKVRVVFDASAKTTSGLSLNDVLKVGPKIQSDLFDIVVRMRMHPIVITADAEKMYRMILIHKTQRDFQRILWRYDPNDEIKPYRLNTVTYGTSSTSFLATRVLHQVVLNCRNSNAVASNIILRDFYMDDLITGSDDWQEALKIKDELASILAKSGLKLRKWQSNDSRVLHNENNQLDKFQINDGTETRALGIVWHPREDTLHYSTDFEIKNDKITKRVILSQVARIFDPLGLINPCIMKAKLILQEFMQLQSDWDDEIPDCLKQK
ncbi:uncharacterized protein [Onthophagus taurus]|uniref:uncharacterized protein n=1 Tax=Onthophagus taurus TaxID=166361 RepID=UPI0039BE623C